MVKRYGATVHTGCLHPSLHTMLRNADGPGDTGPDLRDLNSSTSSAAEENCEINEIVMVVRDADEERWKVLERFRLRG